ncbi:hypothetical protein ACQJBY_066369 [Aegilops geniculata]
MRLVLPCSVVPPFPCVSMAAPPTEFLLPRPPVPRTRKRPGRGPPSSWLNRAVHCLSWSFSLTRGLAAAVRRSPVVLCPSLPRCSRHGISLSSLYRKSMLCVGYHLWLLLYIAQNYV